MPKFWTLDENKILTDKYANTGAAELLVLLPGRSLSGISGHAAVLGILKSQQYHNSGMSGRICAVNDIGFETRFLKKHPGWNKGLKQSDYMSAEAIEKTKIGRFKKGSDPHNTVPIGFERLSKDGYIEVKIKHLKNGGSNNGNFEFKHRIVYMENYGPIPEGMIVEFIDRDKLNFAPTNFILRTRKENLLTNTMCDQSIVKRFMGIREPELVGKIINEMPAVIILKRNAIKLNQKINKNAKRTE
jgi:hypothetical protein